MTKILLSIPNHDGYAITPDGEVWSFWRLVGTGYGRGNKKVLMPNPVKKMTPRLDCSGYFRIGLRISNTTRKRARAIHQIMLEAYGFLRPSPEHQVRHLNGNKTDNRIENLAWGTPAENGADRALHGVMPKGEDSHLAKLKNAQALEIFNDRSTSASLLANKYGVSRKVIWRIRTGQTYTKATV